MEVFPPSSDETDKGFKFDIALKKQGNSRKCYELLVPALSNSHAKVVSVGPKQDGRHTLKCDSRSRRPALCATSARQRSGVIN